MIYLLIILQIEYLIKSDRPSYLPSQTRCDNKKKEQHLWNRIHSDLKRSATLGSQIWRRRQDCSRKTSRRVALSLQAADLEWREAPFWYPNDGLTNKIHRQKKKAKPETNRISDGLHRQRHHYHAGQPRERPWQKRKVGDQADSTTQISHGQLIKKYISIY